MNYQSTFTINAPGGGGFWKFDAVLLPHPIGQMYVRTSLADDTASAVMNHLNPQVTGVTHSEKFASFCKSFERWRLAYMAVTVYQDAPALANQGTIVVSQPPCRPRRVNLGTAPIPYTDVNRVSALCLPHLDMYDQDDYPQYDRSQALPNAYFARSDAGAYVPLKLTNTHQKWHSLDEAVMVANDLSSALIPPDLGVLNTTGGVAIQGVPTLSDIPPTGSYPFPSLMPCVRVANVSSVGRTSTVMAIGQSTSEMCNDTWAHISARNLSQSCSYSFFVRAGFEVQTCPSSPMSPQVRLSPPYDPMALDHYYAIARELKDAYPADYNDLGKLWDVIKSTANFALPYVKRIPWGVGSSIAGLEPGVRAGVSALEKALMPSTSRDTPSAAVVARARRVAIAATGSKKKNRGAGRKGKS